MSDQVVFKKRTRGSGQTRKQSTEVVEPETDASSVQDLLTLRSLSKKPTGIDLHRLNKGDRKQRTPTTATTTTTNEKDAESDHERENRRLVRRNNFQGETGTVDVDKHMMAYIEAQMRQHHPDRSPPPEHSKSAAAASHPYDELYAVAEKYKALQSALKPELTQEEREGDVALSAAMLTSIPEVDLGIDSRLRNIQQTEQAKRLLQDQQQRLTPHQERQDQDAFSATRFMRSNGRVHTDSDSNPPRRQTATDQHTLDRFKKRQKIG